MIGAPVALSLSAPTALALWVAGAAGTALTDADRSDAFEVFTHPSRIALETVRPVASGRPALTRSG